MPASITMAMVVKAVITAVVSVTLSTIVAVVARSMAPKPRTGTAVDTGPLSSSLEVGGPKRVVVGRVGVRAGRLIANKRIGQVHHWVAALSDWPIASVEGVFVRGVAVTLDGDGWVTSGPWAEGGAQTIKFTFYDGEQTAPLADLVALDLVEAGAIGLQTAIVHAEITIPQTEDMIRLFGGAVPDFIFDLKGARLYDPTDAAQDPADRATWVWAQEAILVQAFHQVCPLGRNRPVAEIDWSQVAEILPRHRAAITSRRGDTAPRFACNGIWRTRVERHEDVEARIGRCHAGGLVDNASAEAEGGGALQRFWTSDPDAAAVAEITGADIGRLGLEGPTDAAPIDERPNGVRVAFYNAPWVWEQYSLVLEDAAAVAEDGGGVNLLELDLDMVTAHAQAATLGLIAYNRARHGKAWAGQFAPRLLPLEAGDVVTADLAEAGIDAADRLRVAATAIDGSDHARLDLALDLAAWHADAGDDEPTEIELVLDDAQGAAPAALPAPTVTASSGGTALVDIDGIILPGLRVVVTGTAGLYEAAQITVGRAVGGDDNDQTQIRRFDGGASVSALFSPLRAGVEYSYAVSVSASGRVPAVVTGLHTVSGDATAPAAPSALVATGGAGTLEASATAPADADTVSLVFAYVADGAAAPDMATHATRVVNGCSPGETTVVASWSSVGAGAVDVYVAAVDRAGNIGASAGPADATVT